MIDPNIGQKIRFTDMYNGTRYEGRVQGTDKVSHYDYPVWVVQVTDREGEQVFDGPLLRVTRKEIDEVIE